MYGNLWHTLYWQNTVNYIKKTWRKKKNNCFPKIEKCQLYIWPKSLTLLCSLMNIFSFSSVLSTLAKRCERVRKDTKGVIVFYYVLLTSFLLDYRNSPVIRLVSWSHTETSDSVIKQQGVDSWCSGLIFVLLSRPRTYQDQSHTLEHQTLQPFLHKRQMARLFVLSSTKSSHITIHNFTPIDQSTLPSLCWETNSGNLLL